MKNKIAKMENMTRAYIKSLTLEEIEDLLRDNLTLSELEELGIAPKTAPL